MSVTIQVPEIKRVVEDFDFVFTSGHFMPVSVDRASGDTVEFQPDGVTIHLSSKPSLNDPEKMLPAEDITIFTKHLISVQKRLREVIERTPEEKFAWAKTFKDMSKTLQ